MLPQHEGMELHKQLITKQRLEWNRWYSAFGSILIVSMTQQNGENDTDELLYGAEVQERCMYCKAI